MEFKDCSIPSNVASGRNISSNNFNASMIYNNTELSPPLIILLVLIRMSIIPILRTKIWEQNKMVCIEGFSNTTSNRNCNFTINNNIYFILFILASYFALSQFTSYFHINLFYKKRNRNHYGNYRGISVTLRIGRLYRRVLKSGIEEEVKETEDKSGFRSGYILHRLSIYAKTASREESGKRKITPCYIYTSKESIPLRSIFLLPIFVTNEALIASI